VILAPYTTYKIGGPARYFIEADNEENIIESVSWAKAQSMPYFILGGGSNILVSDNGFDGLVVNIQHTTYNIQHTIIEADAGLGLPKLVETAINNGLKGIEWASGIPGTFGGAIRGNAGAFGGEIKDIIISVRFLDNKGNIREFNNNECQFMYRGSIFSAQGGSAVGGKNNSEYIILSAKVKLEPHDREVLKKFSRETIEYRTARHPLEYGSCGSVFKAIDVNSVAPSVFEKHPRFSKEIKQDPFPVIPAACFIDEAGLKRHRIGGAMISDKHPNFFINYKNASAKDIMGLINFTKKRVKKFFNIDIEEEVKFVV
jgi:UDP-N-acetylmuramate dehydrogenase